MKTFTQVAFPHEDVREGRLTMDVFAADLSRVAKGEAPPDYQDPDIFFKKTFLTKGLQNILNLAKARLEGRTGDSTIQLQTPFGGGKTHTLIALYHKAKEWNAKVAVFVGTDFDPKEARPWEVIEKSLTGKVELTRGEVSPGKEKLVRLLSENSPSIILMDEILEYITKASGIRVGDSNLASQTLAFIQELTEAVASVGNSLLVVTLPASVLEHYDENAEKTFQQLQKITGRLEKVYTPVGDEEIEHVIRARLFDRIDERESKRIVDEFVNYAKREGLLSNNEAIEYRERFLKSFPFKPEVIDILYKRWGSFPTFQRTRGALRLLSLVVHDLLDERIPFIRLSDFRLENEEIRRELIKHIGSEWDSIFAQDITSQGAGAKKVDISVGESYRPYRLGTAVSTAIFMMSFSGRGEKGTSLKDLKLSVALPEFSSNVIDSVVNQLREKLFYLSDEGLFFTNRPNLNRLTVLKEANFPKELVLEEGENLIKQHLSASSPFKIYIHKQFPKDIPDSPDLKLVILDSDKPDRDLLEKYGESPRKYRNTLIFLCVDENYRDSFYLYIRRLLALQSIEEDESLNLTEGQRKEVKNKINHHRQREYEELRRFYRKLYLPAKDNFKEVDFGIPTFGESKLDREIYEYLRSSGEILEHISPEVIKEKYMQDKDYIEVVKLYEAFLRTPGELRLTNKEAYIKSIKEGVSKGTFGFGYLENDNPVCKDIMKEPQIEWLEREIVIKPELCKKEEAVSQPLPETEEEKGGEDTEAESISIPPVHRDSFTGIRLKLSLPVGQASTVVRLINYLKDKFNETEITIEARGGEISKYDYEDKIKEALKQAGIELIEEEVE